MNIWCRAHGRKITNPGGGYDKHDEFFGEKFVQLVDHTMNMILEKGFLHSKIIEQRE
jgi:hypothetical protein